jgi:hypothetical protein
MEITRLGYNSESWHFPTGEAGEHESGRSHQDQYGFGFEDWLFRPEWTLEGWHYGLVHGMTDSRRRFLAAGEAVDLILFTVEPKEVARFAPTRHRYVAILRGAVCIGDDEAAEVLATYKKRGWFETMRREVAAAHGNVAYFDGVTHAPDIFNVRYEPERVQWFAPESYMQPDDPGRSFNHYVSADVERLYAKRGRRFDLPSLGTLVQSMSPLSFDDAYERFQAVESAHAGKRLESFRDASTLTHGWEAYKDRVAAIAVDRLAATTWKKKQVGTGEILDAVIAAIEFKDNNLLRWQNRYGEAKREHALLIAARQDVEQRTAFESVFFEMYRQKKLGAAQFQALAECCRGSYALVAYLFFIADPERFLPIRPSRFDKVFESLEIELRTAGRCSWDNYHAYLAAIATVRDQLLAYGIADTRLLDAHSFCWVLTTAKDAPPPMQRKITGRTFTGEILPPKVPDKSKPVDQAATVDLDGNHAARLQAGKCAESIALEYERERLHEAGQPNLANAVEDVSNRPAYGYDIRSFETDGSERCIEVKNVSKSNRFILTDNEWQKSQGPQNYWFYLVSRTDTNNPLVEYLCAHDVREKDLKPMQWEVAFRRSKSKK